MIRQWQELVYAGNYHSSHLFGPDYAQARRGVRDPRLQGDDARGGPDPAIEAAQAVDGPALVWFEIARSRTSSR